MSFPVLHFPLLYSFRSAFFDRYFQSTPRSRYIYLQLFTAEGNISNKCLISWNSVCCDELHSREKKCPTGLVKKARENIGEMSRELMSVSPTPQMPSCTIDPAALQCSKFSLTSRTVTHVWTGNAPRGMPRGDLRSRSSRMRCLPCYVMETSR